MSKAYGYIRVSHAEQDLNTLDTQKNAIQLKLRELQVKRPELELGDIFTDQGVSAYKKPFLNRPGGVKLNGRLKKGDVIIFSRVDRAFRRLKDQMHMLEKWKDEGIEYYFCDAPILDSNDSVYGFLVMTLLGTFAEIEARRRSEQTKAGLATKRRKGQAMGTTPRGFKRVRSSTLGFNVFVPDLEKEELAQKILDLKATGLGYNRISDEIEDWMAAKTGRKSRRGTRSCYEYQPGLIRKLHEWVVKRNAEAAASASPGE